MRDRHATGEACRALMATGFGEYEAKAYCALLAESPANGYQIARRSGIPRAKIYECLERLVERGAVARVGPEGDRGAQFAPTDADELVRQVEAASVGACRRARAALGRIRGERRTVEVLWRIMSRADLVARGRRLVVEAGRTLHVAVWDEEFAALLPDLVAAVERGVKLALILYAPHPGLVELQGRGAGAVLHGRTKADRAAVIGNQFVVVADQRQCIIGSVLPDGHVEGVFTTSPGLLINAADLVNHEIYFERILLEAGRPVFDHYGRGLRGLDAFDPPGAARPTRSRTAAGSRRQKRR